MYNVREIFKRERSMCQVQCPGAHLIGQSAIWSLFGGQGRVLLRYERLGVQEAADKVARLVSRTVAALLCGPRSGEAAAADSGNLAPRLALSKDINDAWMACKGSMSALADSSNLDAGPRISLLCHAIYFMMARKPFLCVKVES